MEMWRCLLLFSVFSVINGENCRGEAPKPRECDRICDENNNCKIRAALLLPRNTSYDACIAAVEPVFELAMLDHAVREAFPPWIEFEWMTYDVTDCDAAYAVISAIDAYNDCTNVFFGPSCDFALASVARITKFLGATGIPLVTTGGFTFDFVKPKQTCNDEFYMMVRAGPMGFEDLAYFIIDLMGHYGWRQLLLINEPEAQIHVAGKSTCLLMMKSFANFLKKEDIIYTPWDTTSSAGLNYTENLKFYLGYKYTSAQWFQSNGDLHVYLEPSIRQWMKFSSRRYFNAAPHHPNPLVVQASSYSTDPVDPVPLRCRPKHILVEPDDPIAVMVSAALGSSSSPTSAGGVPASRPSIFGTGPGYQRLPPSVGSSARPRFRPRRRGGRPRPLRSARFSQIIIQTQPLIVLSSLPVWDEQGNPVSPFW